MIVPMRKFVFMVYHAEYQGFLEDLRALGVVDVTERVREAPAYLADMEDERKRLRGFTRALKRRKPEEAPPPPKKVEGAEVADDIAELLSEQEQLAQRLAAVRKEIEALSPWGVFSLETLDRLAEAGLEVCFFVASERNFKEEWARQYSLALIARKPPMVYFIIIREAGRSIDIEAEPMPRPSRALPEAIAEGEALQARLRAIDRLLDRHAAHSLPALESHLAKVEQKIAFEKVILSTQAQAEEKVMILEGFAPRPQEKKVKDYCDKNNILYLEANPKAEDNPPILLANNRFSRYFEPLGRLFALPSYGELDLTPFFAPFFLLFFGFCLGDAGYGLVLLLGAAVYKWRLKKNAPLRPYLTLAQFLGLGTILFGILTGTFFGLNLMEDRFVYLGQFRRVMLDSEQTFNLALGLGLAQILFGLTLQAVNRGRQLGWAYAVPSVGWMLLLLAILDIALLKATGRLSTYAAYLSVGLILFFSDPKGSVFARLGKGLWDLYNITGFFGDLLSYIRLFALGISSAILGLVINEIALQTQGIPYVGPAVFVLVLVVGHAANLLIASLGAFVHPLRLTFVEFYKNAGFAGGGRPYRPFTAHGGEPDD
jgi:V/A-type H+-transporting ATPase subunit I